MIMVMYATPYLTYTTCFICDIHSRFCNQLISMLGKFSLIISSKKSALIVATKFIFQYDGDRKVPIGQFGDKDVIETKENLIVECPFITDYAIKYIDSSDDPKWLLSEYESETDQRIRIIKTLSVSTQINQRQRENIVTKRKHQIKIKNAAASRKLERAKTAVNKADRFYKTIKGKESSTSQEQNYVQEKSIENDDLDESDSSNNESLTEEPSQPLSIDLAHSPMSTSTVRSVTPPLIDSTSNKTEGMETNLVIQELTKITNHIKKISTRLNELEKKVKKNADIEEECELVMDENNEVEIIPGVKMDYTSCTKACNTTKMSTRANQVIKFLWPEERRRKFIIRPNKNRETWEVADEAVVIQAISKLFCRKQIYVWLCKKL